MTALIKLTLIPLVIWLASLAGRRWGHATTGWITGLPLIAGPIFLFLAYDQGPEFAADAARAALTNTPAAILHCVVFANTARRFGWLASLAAGIACFAAVGLVLLHIPLPLWAGLALCSATLWLSNKLMPRAAPSSAGAVVIPRSEIVVRMIAALLLAALITLGAPLFGPAYSGLLLTFPISGSIIPAFTRALHGPEATIRMLGGFIGGMIAFMLFIFSFGLGLGYLDVAIAFIVAVGVALAGYFSARTTFSAGLR